MCLREENSGICRIPDRDGDATRVVVVQRREVVDASPAHRLHDTFANAAMQVADELRIRLRQSRTDSEERNETSPSSSSATGSKPSRSSSDVRACTNASGCGAVRRPLPPDGRRFLAVGADAPASAGQQTREQRVAGGSNPRLVRRRRAHRRAAAADRAPVDSFDVDRLLAQAFEMQAHGVGGMPSRSASRSAERMR
jgi:hypothetical protein